MDIPAIDGPCEVATCIDPANVDDGGHGTHVAGTIAAARNGIGIAGVAPDATIVNVRAGQDSGYFFLYETVAALTYAGDIGLDVVNMSFYTDPWLYNCDVGRRLHLRRRHAEQIAEQAFVRSTVLAARGYANDHGVTLVGCGRQRATPTWPRPPAPTPRSPDYPPGTAAARVVTDNCLDLPSEGPDVISGVRRSARAARRPTTRTTGFGDVEISAPRRLVPRRVRHADVPDARAT